MRLSKIRMKTGVLWCAWIFALCAIALLFGTSVSQAQVREKKMPEWTVMPAPVEEPFGLGPFTDQERVDAAKYTYQSWGCKDCTRWDKAIAAQLRNYRGLRGKEDMAADAQRSEIQREVASLRAAKAECGKWCSPEKQRPLETFVPPSRAKGPPGQPPPAVDPLISLGIGVGTGLLLRDREREHRR